MKTKDKINSNEIAFWLNDKLQFAVSMVRDANTEHNFNKETYYAAQADAYEAILDMVKDNQISD